MAKKGKKAKRGSRPIVVGHLEKVGRGVFSRFQKQITECVKGSFGVYALYKRDKLYYIGLASNLKSRIRGHLKDKHGKSWTHFSLYVFRRESHIRELESLLLRIAFPEGNLQRGKLKGSLNLKPKLKVQVKRKIKEEYEAFFKSQRKTTRKVKGKATSKDRPLRGIFPGGKVIYATYKGKKYKAWVLANGGIKFKGNIYETPTGVAKEVVKKGAVNGWNFWKFKNEKGKLVKLKELRR